MFSQDGTVWKHSRELIKPTFSRSEIANLGLLDTCANHLLGLLPYESETIDVQPLLHRAVLRVLIPGIEAPDLYCDQFLGVSTDFVFGEPVNAILPNTPFDSFGIMKAFNGFPSRNWISDTGGQPNAPYSGNPWFSAPC